jgi:hypothetical protein
LQTQSSELKHQSHKKEKKEREKERRRKRSFKSMPPSDLLPPIRPHLLKFPEPFKIAPPVAY